MARCTLALTVVALGLLSAGPALTQGPWGPTGPQPPMAPYPPRDNSAQASDGASEPRPINVELGDPNITAAPPPTLAYSNGGSPNAFATDTDELPLQGFYAGVGIMALQRERLGNSAIALKDQGVSIPGFPTFFDHGFKPRRDTPEALNFKDLRQNIMPGGRFVFGYQLERDMVEFQGFYLPGNRSRKQYIDEARLDVLFFNSPATPLGFSGDNNLWLQADKVRISLETTLASAELNYRWANGGGIEYVLGLRYFDLNERFSIFTDDDNLQLSPEDADPTLVADYTVRAHNRLVGPQLGIECCWPVKQGLLVGGQIKGTWGANFIETHIQLIRGDGFRGPEGVYSEVQFAHAYEGQLFFELLFSDRIRARLGYQVMWLANVAEAHEQIDFNLRNIKGRERTEGSVFYHGPVVELNFAF